MRKSGANTRSGGLAPSLPARVMRGAPPGPAGRADQPGRLHDVQRPGHPVEHQPPPGQPPADRAGHRRRRRRHRRGEQQHRERGQQQERGGLADVVHRRRAVAVPAQHRQRAEQQQLPGQQRRRELPRHHLAGGEREQGGEDVEPVGERVEQLPEPADLAQPAGDPTVDPVGGAADGEHHDRGHVGLRDQQQVEEERHAQQPDEADQVRQRQHPVAAVVPVPPGCPGCSARAGRRDTEPPPRHAPGPGRAPTVAARCRAGQLPASPVVPAGTLP